VVVALLHLLHPRLDLFLRFGQRPGTPVDELLEVVAVGLQLFAGLIECRGGLRDLALHDGEVGGHLADFVTRVDHHGRLIDPGVRLVQPTVGKGLHGVGQVRQGPLGQAVGRDGELTGRVGDREQWPPLVALPIPDREHGLVQLHLQPPVGCDPVRPRLVLIDQWLRLLPRLVFVEVGDLLTRR